MVPEAQHHYVPAARADVVEQQQAQIELLSKAILDLREKVSYNESEVEHVKETAQQVSEWIELVEEEEENQQAKKEATFGTELVPTVQDVNKVPVSYSDKSFWYLSLPLAHMGVMVKRFTRALAGLVVTPSASVESTRLALEEAHRDRELLNIIRIQRKVEKIKKRISNAIRKNKDSLVIKVGENIPENLVASQVLQDHFIATGLCSKVVNTTDNQVIWLHVDLAY